MNRLNVRLVLCAFLTFLVTDAAALPDGSSPPDMVDMSATYAKTRAKLRAYQVDFRSSGTEVDPFAIGSLDTAGCDVNVGNVSLNGSGPAPDDIIVFVQGDILQANNCR